MLIFKKIINQSAQVTFESALVITLVMAGIIITGPYVIRAWNASIQMTSDSVNDSFDENFEEANRIGIPNIPCSCTSITGGAPDTCGISPCVSQKYRKARYCLPIGCADIEEDCFEDPQCCNSWTDDGCGAAAVQNPNKCPDGEKSYKRLCGIVGWQYECRSDPTCIFNCVGEDANGNPDDPYDRGWCLSGGRHDDRLSSDTTVTYVVKNSCPASDAASRCVAECC